MYLSDTAVAFPVAFDDMDELLRAQDLGRKLGAGGAWVLRHTALTLNAGDRVLLRGPSGAGKTILLRSLALLDPVEEGEICWRGEPVSDRDVPRFRRDVAYLHQAPVLMEGTVEENLRLPYGLVAHSDRSFEVSAVQALVAAAGLDALLLERRASELSGGERQIVALVRLLQLRPTALLLDEPTASLDADAARRVTSLVDEWAAAEPGRAFVWIGHDPALIRPIASRELSLRTGRAEAR